VTFDPLTFAHQSQLHIFYRYVWQSQWGPTYRYSYAVCIATISVSTGMLGVMHLHLKRFNDRIAREERDNEALGGTVGFRYLV
jgi:hypothetical protein